MELKLLCSVIILSFFWTSVSCANILALFSSLSFADHLVFRGYVSLLVQRGHSVALMTAYPGQFPFVDAERLIELDVGQESGQFWEEYKKLLTNTDDYYKKMNAINDLTLKIAIAQLKSKQMTALFINPNVKFDLVITEADVPLLYAVAEKYKAPHVAITTSSGKLSQFESKGCSVHPFLYPDVNTINYGNLTLWQKISELSRHYYSKQEYYSSYLPTSQVAAQKILELKRDLVDVEKDIDLLLVASNPVLTGNRPTVPAVAYVDRMHIKPGVPLPQKLQAILDAATKGVIYFSLGALQDSEQLSPMMLRTLSQAFSELDYTVLWKIGNTTAINVTDNIIPASWFPQQEVLAHPNVKAFITHGGPRSLEEAVFYEVPIVGIPLMKSRAVFIKEITKHGAGEVLDPYYLEKESLKAVISTVASNESYKKSITLLKYKVQDLILSGPESAVLWTEHIIRNREGRHLRSPAADVTSFTYCMVDVIVTAALFILAGFWLIMKVVKRLTKKVRVRFFGAREDKGKFKAL